MLFHFSLLVLGVLVLLVQANDSLLVNTKYGYVQGQLSATNKEWLGIPFAEPPVGPLRWQPPKAPVPWTTRNATSYGSYCMQPSIPGSEDCLTLNVFAPTNSTNSSSLPVYIFVHGGSFIYLSSEFFDGAYLAGQDIIVVTVNYRLGALGFLYHPELAANSSTGSSGFYGIQDQRLAFQWVKENIAAFGGNPNKVTIGGESAGAISICLHLVAPKSAPYFHQAVMQSGGCYAFSVTDGAAVGDIFASVLNCTKDNLLECMYSASASEIMTAQSFLGGWSPTADPTELSSTPERLIQQGKINSVPLLIGTNKNEWSGTYCDAYADYATLNESAYAALIASSYYWIDQSLLLKTYPLSNYPNALQAIIDAASDFMFKCSTKAVANIFSVANPTYLFSFDHHASCYDSKPNGECYGAAHADELYMLFPSYSNLLNCPLNATEKSQISIPMRQAWVDFTVNGTPQLPSITWPKYNSTTNSYAQIDMKYSTANEFRQQCSIWNLTLASPVHSPPNPSSSTSSSSSSTSSSTSSLLTTTTSSSASCVLHPNILFMVLFVFIVSKLQMK